MKASRCGNEGKKVLQKEKRVEREVEKNQFTASAALDALVTIRSLKLSNIGLGQILELLLMEWAQI